MKGLELSRHYYREIFLPACRMCFPSAVGHFAAGLVGEGSECFGYDDALSRDHSFGLRLCIWLKREDYARYASALNTLWLSLPETFEGYKKPAADINEGKRNGVFSVSEFYERILGIPDAPANMLQWLSIAEPHFAAATNGEIFSDDPGSFTSVRKKLLAYFPEDIARYYMAQYAALAAQTGQYNLLRAHLHGEELAASNIKASFTQSAIAMVFLLNKTYRPFYKWAPKAMRSLPILGGEIYGRLLRLSEAQDIKEQCSLVEEVCARLLAQMRLQGYTTGKSEFLIDHLPEIMGRIESPEVRDRGVNMVF